MTELSQLLPEPRVIDPEQAYGHLELATLAPREGTYVIANMVSSADGSATLAGKSSGVSSGLDRKLFHVLRTQVDAVMVGATTIGKEDYGQLMPGADKQPLTVTVTRNMNLPLESRLFEDPDSRIAVITNCNRPLPETAAKLSAIRTPGEAVDFEVAFAELRRDYGIASMLLEGGPTLLGIVAAAGQLDELFLTISPLIGGGGIGPRVVGGPTLADPIRLDLKSALTDQGSLFLRYAVQRATQLSRP